MKDHLGSVRLAFRTTGSEKIVVQENTYYPSGAPIADMSWNASLSTNRYKHTGMETIEDFSLGYIDNGARWRLNNTAPMFMGIDPLAEKYYHISPYIYCSNNPINKIDPDGRMDDWVRDKKTNEYIWMDNVTSRDNTPKNYVYVGANDNDLLTDLNISSTYQTKTQTDIGVVTLGGDNVGPSGQGIFAPTGRNARGNLSVSADVSINLRKGSENNALGRKFEGVTVSATLSQMSGQGDGDATAKGHLTVSTNNKNYSEMLNTPTDSRVKPIGTLLSVANLHIPARDITKSTYLSTALISAGVTNPALVWPPSPIKMNWDLQITPIYRQK